MKISQSNNWRYKISIKSNFEDEVTPELVISLSALICSELESVKKKLSSDKQAMADDKYDLMDKINDLIDNFEFARDLANGTIGEDEWDNYSFDGDFEVLMNDYITQLYDVADERIMLKGGILEKFLWVE